MKLLVDSGSNFPVRILTWNNDHVKHGQKDKFLLRISYLLLPRVAPQISISKLDLIGIAKWAFLFCRICSTYPSY